MASAKQWEHMYKWLKNRKKIKKIRKILRKQENETVVEATIKRFYLIPNHIPTEQIKDWLDNYSLDENHASRDYYKMNDVIITYSIRINKNVNL